MAPRTRPCASIRPATVDATAARSDSVTFQFKSNVPCLADPLVEMRKIFPSNCARSMLMSSRAKVADTPSFAPSPISAGMGALPPVTPTTPASSTFVVEPWVVKLALSVV